MRIPLFWLSMMRILMPCISNRTLSFGGGDFLGREVQTLVSDKVAAGNHDVKFEASNLPSGAYFYRLQADGMVETKKMLLVR